MSYLYNNVNRLQIRRSLRISQTKAEGIIWKSLRNRPFPGIKLRRQYSIGPYVVDFYCAGLRLAIEIDGPTHFESEDARQYDAQREAYIEKLNIRILRFTNEQVYRDLSTVLEVIKATVESMKRTSL